MKKLIFLLSIACLTQPAFAKLYKCNNGNMVTYTNKPTNGCVALDLEPLSTYSTNKSGGSRGGGSSAPKQTPSKSGSTATKGNYPSVDANTQAGRDQGRRQILESELANERKALADAQKALSDGQQTRQGNEKNYAKYQERIGQLQNAVTDRQKNVQAIQNEINRL